MTTVICPFCGYIYAPGDLAMMPGSLTIEDHFDEECVRCDEIFTVHRELTASDHVQKKEVTS